MNRINKNHNKSYLVNWDEIANCFIDLENYSQTFLFLPLHIFDAVLSRYLLLPISIRRLFIVFDIPTFFEKIHRSMHIWTCNTICEKVLVSPVKLWLSSSHSKLMKYHSTFLLQIVFNIWIVNIILLLEMIQILS